MSHKTAEIFRQAAELNRKDPLRQGNVLMFEAGCEIMLTGDIHGHRGNLVRALGYAAPLTDPRRKLILQEIIHGPTDAATGQDLSHELMLRAARMKIANPANVFFLLGNHDVAQAAGNEITKEGCGVCKKFKLSVGVAYGQDAPDILDAINDFLLSMPLAARCPGGQFISHSLPSPGRKKMAGTEILSRPYEQEDLRRGGAVYEWTWGRAQTPELVDELAGQLNAGFFLLGHKHIPEGWEMITPKCAALASDHEKGCLIHFQADEALSDKTIPDHIKRMNTL
ncbi:MAG: metallophosphoesterase [Planctomycetes bacterium]|nr:metallophosphoesterase [Planctomycetota bacterium]